MRDFGVLFMLRPRMTLAAVFLRQIQNLLKAVNRRAEAGDHEAAGRAHKTIFQARTDGALAFGVAGRSTLVESTSEQHAALTSLGPDGESVSSLCGCGIDFISPVQ